MKRQVRVQLFDCLRVVAEKERVEVKGGGVEKIGDRVGRESVCVQSKRRADEMAAVQKVRQTKGKKKKGERATYTHTYMHA